MSAFGGTYSLLWEERELTSVANLTRKDGNEFFTVVAKAGIVTQIVPFPLSRMNDALSDLRTGRLQGAAVLVP
jgi:alcohol dehydrogenase, propanol-preferring